MSEAEKPWLLMDDARPIKPFVFVTRRLGQRYGARRVPRKLKKRLKRLQAILDANMQLFGRDLLEKAIIAGGWQVRVDYGPMGEAKITQEAPIFGTPDPGYVAWDPDKA